MCCSKKHNPCAKKHFLETGFPGILASSDGQIKYKGDILPQYNGGGGYPAVSVGWYTQKYMYVHRLVAFAHVPNPCPGVFTVVDHIDRYHFNNHASNLRWLTHQLNCMNTGAHKFAYFRRKKKWFDGRSRHWRFSDKWGKAFMEKNKHGPATQGYWEALCTVQGKKKYLGYFKTYLEAHLTATTFRDKEFARIYEEHIKKAANDTS